MSNIKFSYCGKTDQGRCRSNNEDAYVVQPLWDDHHVLAVAIDGVGGRKGGEVAAEISQKAIPEYLEDEGGKNPLLDLRDAVLYADNCITSYRNGGDMCCVLTAAIIDGQARKIYIAHVGDTRLYQFANGELVKLTKDDSIVGPLEESGELTEKEAMNHPHRNIITKSVGHSNLNDKPDSVFVKELDFDVPTAFLLCSDGLYDMVTSKKMAHILAKNGKVESKVDALIQAANKAGGRDNVTVVLVEMEEQLKI